MQLSSTMSSFEDGESNKTAECGANAQSKVHVKPISVTQAMHSNNGSTGAVGISSSTMENSKTDLSDVQKQEIEQRRQRCGQRPKRSPIGSFVITMLPTISSTFCLRFHGVRRTNYPI